MSENAIGSSVGSEIVRPQRRKKTPQGSFVISVKQGINCYRHLKVPKHYRLDALADAILWAFDFINDHAHAFFMNNKAWMDNDCYYLDAVDEEEEFRHAGDYALSVLRTGQQFKFVFDFGDNRTFDCAVLREITEDTQKEAELIRSKGEPPSQYGYSSDDDAINDADDDADDGGIDDTIDSADDGGASPIDSR